MPNERKGPETYDYLGGHVTGKGIFRKPGLADVCLHQAGSDLARSKHRRRLGWTPVVAAIAILLLAAGCESDPILAPQTEESKTSGSYGLTAVPGAGPKDDERKKRNPELF